MVPMKYIHDDDWKRLGFGIGIEPFKWRRFGHVHYYGTSHWFNLGPIFIQWSWPKRNQRNIRY